MRIIRQLRALHSLKFTKNTRQHQDEHSAVQGGFSEIGSKMATLGIHGNTLGVVHQDTS